MSDIPTDVAAQERFEREAARKRHAEAELEAFYDRTVISWPPKTVPLYLVLTSSDPNTCPWPTVTSDEATAREWARRRGGRCFRVNAEEMT